MNGGSLPLGGYWISPEGEMYLVTEHWQFIKEHPEVFLIPKKKLRGVCREDLERFSENLMRMGWIRFRWFLTSWNFQVDRLPRRMDQIEAILILGEARADERIYLSQIDPERDYSGHVGEFFDRSMFRHYELGEYA